MQLPFLRLTPATLVRRLQSLPSEPKVLHRLQKLLLAPDTGLDDIARLVQLEPGLTARVMRTANSALFSFGRQADSLEEAMQRVGLKRVHELVTFAVAGEIVARPLSSYRMTGEALWSRAIACGLAAGSLATRSDADPQEAYTAGLMHLLGLVVIDRHVAEQKEPRFFESQGYPRDFEASEKAWLGFSHAEAGAALLERWGFSEAIAAAVEHQIEPEKAKPEHRRLSTIVATARWARSLLCVAQESVPELPKETWMAEVGLKFDDFSEWLGEVRRKYTLTEGQLRPR